MKTTHLILIPFCCLLGAHPASGKDPSPKPNIIVIFTDDHGYADLGCQGIMKDVKTPHIDALAANGVRMTDGHVTAPQCSPSRCGLISGQYQQKFGMEDNGSWKTDPTLKKRFFDLPTLPARLKKAGYATGMAGKSHLGSDDSAELLKLGFDKAFFKHSDAAGHWNMDLEGKDIPPQEQPKLSGYHLELITTFACTFIERFKSQPFFFYLAYRAPHVPLDAPPKYLARFPGPMPEERRKALASISCVDDGVGRIMETLRKNGLEDNTLIFLIGDNGAPLKMMPHEFVASEDNPPLKSLKPGTPGDWNSWDGSLNEPMNGEKGMLTEGGIRTPFVVSWKGTIPGGQVYTKPVISLDVAATANAAAGLPDDPVLDGVNLIPFLTGDNTGQPHEALFWRWDGQSAIRKGDWKYLTSGDRQYLFNLATDPEEKHNLFAKQPEQARELRTQLEQWSRGLTPPGIGPEEMTKPATVYYDFYLDGKSGPAVAPKETRKGKGRGKGAAAAKTPETKMDSDRPPGLFELRDVDKDGRVTWEEFLKDRTGPTVAILEKHFKALDRDGDGVWTKSDLPPASTTPDAK